MKRPAADRGEGGLDLGDERVDLGLPGAALPR